MDSRTCVCPVALPNLGYPGFARASVLARTFSPLPAIRSRLELVVLGLEQGRISQHRIWNRPGVDPVCGDAAKPAALVVIFLVSGGPDSAGSDRDYSAGDRSAIQ